LLGKLSGLEVHHIFPKSLLYEHGYSKSEVNAIANLTFLTKETNLKVSNKKPDEYFTAFEKTKPGAIATHWIPMKAQLWQLENYQEFLAARRELLAKAANNFLNSLLCGTIPEVKIYTKDLAHFEVVLPFEEQILYNLNAWIKEQGLQPGVMMEEITTDIGNAVFDLAWSDGLQVGKSQPVALILDKDLQVEKVANYAGFRYFVSIDSFKKYVMQKILAVDDSVAMMTLE
jgi:Protein of unknown function (DUF1524)